MPLLSLDALVLQAFRYSDTSKILRLLTPTHGVRSVIARGALRPRSPYGGVLEPFTDGVATIYLKANAELLTLTAFEPTRSRQGLGSDLLRFGGASLLTELVLRTASEQPDPELFHQLRDALDRLLDAPAEALESVVLAESWALVQRLGFGPALDHCLHCGRALAPGEPARIQYAAGGLHCDACPATGPGRPLPPAARTALARLCAGEPVPLQRTAAHWALLARFLAYHVLEGASLRSLAFLSDAVERDRCSG